MTRMIERFAIVALAVALGGLWLVGRDRTDAADDKRAASELFARVTLLESDLRVAYNDRLSACERGNVIRNVLHQFIAKAAATRRLTPEPGDIETAQEYEALDRLIWPYPGCTTLVQRPASAPASSTKEE